MWVRAVAVTALLAGAAAAVKEGSASDPLLVAPSGNFTDVLVPDLAPSPASDLQGTTDCLSESGAFYGADVPIGTSMLTSSAEECCAACREAADCSIWNWCVAEAGCEMPAPIAAAANVSSYVSGTCAWKLRQVDIWGTTPQPSPTNRTAPMQGWTSGIPINSSVLPALVGFQLTAGIELPYDPEVDFYCNGSTTSKPVCEIHQSTKAGAAACVSNDRCRGFQVCFSWPLPTPPFAQMVGSIRLKSGDEAPLNLTSAVQNPYCAVYVDTADAPNPAGSGFVYNVTDGTATLGALATGEYDAAGGRRRLLKEL